MELVVWAVVLVLLALVFVVLEVFIPSGGVLGVFSALFAAAALVVAFMAGYRTGIVMLAVMLVLAPAAVYGAVTLWPKTAVGRAILIPLPDDPDDLLPDTEEYRQWKQLIGRQGVVKTQMMPCGTIVIDGRAYDAVTDGVPADPGQAIQVIDLQTNQLVVRVLAAHEPTEAQRPPAGDLLSRPVQDLGLESLEEPWA